jgi:hypothetical protein
MHRAKFRMSRAGAVIAAFRHSRELLGESMIPSDPETCGADGATSGGACCPSVFTRTRYAATRSPGPVLARVLTLVPGT